jgi:16S rRNA (guanine527-N7)-methyltransferase
VSADGTSGAAPPPPGLEPRLTEYARLLTGWPGLVSGPAEPLVEDSLVLLPLLGKARTLLDVGSGGGMPGLPLKLARPELEVTLLEADQRKAAFLVHAAARLGVGVEVVAERAELAARRARLRESFQVVTCRALAALPVALELCLPFVALGGRLLGMRTAEEDEAGPGLAEVAARLGGGRPEVVEAPSSSRSRGTVVVVPKIAETPSAFPRRPGVPNRRPLGSL